MLDFVKLLITFFVSMYSMCVMFVEHFEPRGKHFIIIHSVKNISATKVTGREDYFS